MHALLLAALVSVLASGPGPGPGDGARCEVIAHRGASAYLPEHTLEAYALAYGQGADMIEPDVVLTRDGVAVCSHDVTVPNTALMGERFPGRAREDGEWYFADFTLDELRCVGQSPGRGGDTLRGLQLATFDECLALVGRLNETTGRRVGVIPEPKRPAFHREEGLAIEPVVVETLGRYGYTDRDHAAIIQCFELDALKLMRGSLGCELRMIYLCGDPVSDGTLDEVASFADGIGPSWKLVEAEEGGPGKDPDLIARALARGLSVYAYTFGSDTDRQQRFIAMGITGMFTNNPDIGRRVVDGAPTR
ncbi:MAG: hypothetical protein IT431_02665 [Phycisphaerales bacterium]|nr:hypothetical protein [Phycisphaerales bacterium]